MDILNCKLIKAEAKSFISQDRKWLTMALACLPLFLVNGAISGGFNFVLNFSENGDVSSSSFSIAPPENSNVSAPHEKQGELVG